MSRAATIVGLVGLACLGRAPDALAQQSSGMFGNRNLGGAYSAPASNFGGSAAARGAYGGAGGGFGAGSPFGAGGSIAGVTQRGDSMAGQVTGSERFIRGNRQGGQFVGADSSDAARFFSVLGNSIATQNTPGQNNRNQDPNAQQVDPRTLYRTQLNVAFAHASAAVPVVVQKLQARYTNTRWIQQVQPIRVTLEGSTAILQGTVVTAHDRDLAEQLALLEPGVAAVQNELTIAAAPEPLPLPPQEQPAHEPTEQ